MHADAGDYNYLMWSGEFPHKLDVIIYCYEREKLEQHMQTEKTE